MGWPSGWLGRVGDFELRIIPVNQPNCTLPALRLRAKKDAGSARAIWRLSGDAYVIGRRGGIAPPNKKWNRQEGLFHEKYSAVRAILLTADLELQSLLYAAPIARRCWKHSRQKTGRPCVGRKGTVVSFPHCEQFVFVSERIGEAWPPPPPPPSARLALQPLQRFGSFLKPLSAKNICSPAVKTNSAPHSEHFSTLSWYSMSRSPLVPCRAGVWADFVPDSLDA